MNRALADSGFWKALLLPEDSYKKSATAYYERVVATQTQILLPWPAAIEVFNSSLFKAWRDVRLLEQRLERQFEEVQVVPDEKYRAEALNSLRGSTSRELKPLQTASLTDRIIWLMLNDKRLEITEFIHNNPRDFGSLPYYLGITTITLTA